MMPATTRDQLRALADAATPGPWEYEWDEDEGEITVRAGTARVGEDGFAPGSYVTTDMILEHEDAWPEDSGEQHAADAEFIAAARTAVPALLDQLDQAEARIKAVRELLDVEERSMANLDIGACGIGEGWSAAVSTADVRRALDGER